MRGHKDKWQNNRFMSLCLRILISSKQSYNK